MPIASDFTIDYANRTIKHTANANVYSVNELYSWLMDLFDDNNQLDDPVPLQADSTQNFKLINEWFIDDASIEYLTGDNTVNAGSSAKNGGSITTDGWTRVIDSVAGVVRVPVSSGTIVKADAGNTITHADGDSGVLLDVETISGTTYLWIRPDSSAAANNFDSTSGNLTCNAHTSVQSGAAETGETEWSNIYSIGTGQTGRVLYVEQNGALVNKWSNVYTNGPIDFLIRTKMLSTAIDSGLVTVFCRDWGYTYDHFTVDLANGGRLPAAITIAEDPDNDTADPATVEAYTIGVTFGSYNVDVTGDGSTEAYEIEVNLASTYTVKQAYEYLKAITRRGETTTYDGVAGQFYRSANPGTYAEKKTAPFGTFAGGKFFGARGLHFALSGGTIDAAAGQANLYELIDSGGTTRLEPTSISVAVSQLAANDVVFVAQSTGDGSTTVDTSQFTTAAASGSYNGTGDTEVKLTESIPQDVPSSGYLRIGPNGDRYQYDSYTGDTFTLNAGNPLTTDYSSTNCYVPWIDDTASGASYNVSVAYASVDRDVVIRVRKAGIKPYEAPGKITTNGMSASALRLPDNVVTV